MGLYWVDETASDRVKEIPRSRKEFFYHHWDKKGLTETEKQCIVDHINNTIDCNANLDNKGTLLVNPGVMFSQASNQWQDPIMSELVYKKMCNENFVNAGFMLGLLVYMCLFKRDDIKKDEVTGKETKDVWNCVKTSFDSNTDFTEIFYWKNSSD